MISFEKKGPSQSPKNNVMSFNKEHHQLTHFTWNNPVNTLRLLLKIIKQINSKRYNPYNCDNKSYTFNNKSHWNNNRGLLCKIEGAYTRSIVSHLTGMPVINCVRCKKSLIARATPTWLSYSLMIWGVRNKKSIHTIRSNMSEIRWSISKVNGVIKCDARSALKP